MNQTGRRDYETRRAARIERLRARAERLHSESHARASEAQRIADMRYFQPIIVGHHSEKRSRRDQAKIVAGFDRASELYREAKDCERRAESAERNEAISSDNPSAVAMLRGKLSDLEAQRERWKAIVKALRKADAGALAALVLDPEERRTIQFAAGGNCAWKVTNLSAEIRRVTKRIAELEAAATRTAPAPETFGDVTVCESDNRVQVRFPGKPDEATRAALKRSGFRWAPSVGAWQRMASAQAWHVAREIARSQVAG